MLHAMGGHPDCSVVFHGVRVFKIHSALMSIQAVPRVWLLRVVSAALNPLRHAFQ